MKDEIPTRVIYHQVPEGFDACGRQKCIKCGLTLLDNDASPKAAAFPAGSVTVSEFKNCSFQLAGAEDDAVPCWIADAVYGKSGPK